MGVTLRAAACGSQTAEAERSPISPSNEEACNELQRALYSSTPLVVVLGFVGESSIPQADWHRARPKCI